MRLCTYNGPGTGECASYIRDILVWVDVIIIMGLDEMNAGCIMPNHDVYCSDGCCIIEYTFLLEKKEKEKKGQSKQKAKTCFKTSRQDSDACVKCPASRLGNLQYPESFLVDFI